jgi:hypothetical protein
LKPEGADLSYKRLLDYTKHLLCNDLSKQTSLALIAVTSFLFFTKRYNGKQEIASNTN